MTGTLSPKIISALLPILRRIWASASVEPMASPSGRVCDVTRKCLPSVMCCKTCSIWSINSLLLPLFDPAQDLVNSGPVLRRAVEDEIQFGHVRYTQAIQQLMPNIALGRVDDFDRLLALLFVTH